MAGEECAASWGDVLTSLVARHLRRPVLAVVESLKKAGDELFTFLRFPRSQWKALRTNNALERINEEFRRRTKTQASLPGQDAVLLWLFGSLRGQVKLRTAARDLGDLGVSVAKDLSELGVSVARDLGDLGVSVAKDLSDLGASVARDLGDLGVSVAMSPQ